MKRKKILIVDDDPDMCHLFRYGFEQEGFDVHVAHDHTAFREQAFRLRPDLIILDIVLGEEKGPIEYRRLLADGLDDQIPVFFVSSLVEDSPESPATKGKNYALYRKPVEMKRLIEDIKNYLSD
jgi:DNA-binding response OmpR family regulator